MVRRQPVTQRVDQRTQRVDGEPGLGQARFGGVALEVGVGQQVDHGQLLEPDRVVGDDVGDGDRRELGPGLEQLLVLLLGHLDRLALGRDGLCVGLRLRPVLA